MTSALDPIVGLPSSRLRDALADAVERSTKILAQSPAKVDDCRAALESIVALLADVESGTERSSTNETRWNVSRRHVDVLRAELLSVLSADPREADGREIVGLLLALEELLRRSDQTPTGRFVSRLAGAESVNAVVEIAHDIRSPLSSILFLVDTIRRGQSGPVAPVQERQLGLIYSAALGLSTLSYDLIDAVRGERLVDGNPTPFSVTEIILGVCAIVQPMSEEKNLPLSVTFPEVDGRIGYPSALNRVLLNLTTNALRYTDVGTVSIGCTEHSERILEFWVRDTGRGIPDNVLAMLFDGFRPGSVGMRFSSAGLGLAISRTLIEAMGSSLMVDTAVDEGTQFSFVLDLPRA